MGPKARPVENHWPTVKCCSRKRCPLQHNPSDNGSLFTNVCSPTPPEQMSAQTVPRGCEEICGSPRVRTSSFNRAPPLLSRLSETSSADDNMSDADSMPCSPLGIGTVDTRSPLGKELWDASHVPQSPQCHPVVGDRKAYGGFPEGCYHKNNFIYTERSLFIY